MATVGKITVSFSSGSPQSIEVDSGSNLQVDGVKVGSGGDRPPYVWGPKAANRSGFREFVTSGGQAMVIPGSEITSVTLSGNVLTILVVTQGTTATTHVTVDSSSVLVVDAPGRTGHGSLGGSRVVTKIPLALASSIAYVAATAP